MVLMVFASPLSRFKRPSNPPSWIPPCKFPLAACPPKPPDPMLVTPPLEAPLADCPPEPPDPPDAVSFVASFHCFDTFSRPPSQGLSQILSLKLPSGMTTKNGAGGAIVSARDTIFAFGLLFPVIYRSLFEALSPSEPLHMLPCSTKLSSIMATKTGGCSPVLYRLVSGCVDWVPITSCFDLPITFPCKVVHAPVSFFFTYCATVEWSRELYGWMMLELKSMFLSGDIPKGLLSFGSIFATSSSSYIALVRLSAVCRLPTGSIAAFVMSKSSSKWCFVTSRAKVLIDYFVLVASLISGFRSLNVLSNAEGIISPSSKLGVEFRGLLDDYVCLRVLYAIILCIMVYVLCFAIVAADRIGSLAQLSFVVNNDSRDGE